MWDSISTAWAPGRANKAALDVAVSTSIVVSGALEHAPAGAAVRRPPVQDASMGIC